MAMEGRGLFICLYGPDGVGKSTQAKLLEERIKNHDILCRRVRYPVYDQEPSGPQLDELIHKGQKRLPEEEMQQLFAQNRREFEPTLKSCLESGVSVVSENYIGTALVWGQVKGLTIEKIEDINKDGIHPDVAILIDGPKREEMAGHPYGNDEEWYTARKLYLAMADKLGWVRVGADAPILTVANRLWAVVRPVLTTR